MRISDWSSDVCSSDLAAPYWVARPLSHQRAAGDRDQHLQRGPAGAEPALPCRRGCHPVRALGAQRLRHLAETGRSSYHLPPDRKSVVEGKSVSVRVDLGGRRSIKKKKTLKKIK